MGRLRRRSAGLLALPICSTTCRWNTCEPCSPRFHQNTKLQSLVEFNSIWQILSQTTSCRSCLICCLQTQTSQSGLTRQLICCHRSQPSCQENFMKAKSTWEATWILDLSISIQAWLRLVYQVQAANDIQTCSRSMWFSTNMQSCAACHSSR